MVLFFVEHGVGVGVVVHFHLSIDFHVFGSVLYVVEQLLYGECEVFLLLLQYVEFGLALCDVICSGVFALGLFAHVVDFECEDG